MTDKHLGFSLLFSFFLLIRCHHSIKTPYHSEIFIRVIHLKWSNLKNKAIFSQI